jgi:hypothetical protein
MEMIDALWQGWSWKTICNGRLKFIEPIHAPLILVSQIQRSGGTLLSQLFDGHPECHAHPDELYIGRPQKWHWPKIDLTASPRRIFESVNEEKTRRFFTQGYVKASKRGDSEPDYFPFLSPKHLQRRIFEHVLGSQSAVNERAVLDAYMTSYFYAWLDNHNLYTGPKRVVTAFVPRLNMHADSVAGYFRCYPDGLLISVLRNPKTWFISARKHQAKQYGDLRAAADLWNESTQAMIDNQKQYGDRVVVLHFDDLVQRTEPVVRWLAERIGVTFRQELLMPTFNCQPIRADSSFKVGGYGVIQDPVNRHKSGGLNPEEEALIDEKTAELYQRCLATAVSFDQPIRKSA